MQLLVFFWTFYLFISSKHTVKDISISKNLLIYVKHMHFFLSFLWTLCFFRKKSNLKWFILKLELATELNSFILFYFSKFLVNNWIHKVKNILSEMCFFFILNMRFSTLKKTLYSTRHFNEILNDYNYKSEIFPFLEFFKRRGSLCACFAKLVFYTSFNPIFRTIIIF